jgi:hypothetical protein
LPSRNTEYIHEPYVYVTNVPEYYVRTCSLVLNAIFVFLLFEFNSCYDCRSKCIMLVSKLLPIFARHRDRPKMSDRKHVYTRSSGREHVAPP